MTKARIHHARPAELAHFVALLLFRFLSQRNSPTSVLLSGTIETVPLFREMLKQVRAPENKSLLPHLHIFEAMAAKPGPEQRDIPWKFIESNLTGPARTDKLLTEAQIHPYHFSGDPQKDRESYLQCIKQFGEKPAMAVLSIGGGEIPEGEEDLGHLAGILPGNAEIWTTGDPFVEVNGFREPPYTRISITPALIRETLFTVGVLRGAERRATFFRYQRSDKGEIDVPSKLLDCSASNFLCTDVMS